MSFDKMPLAEWGHYNLTNKVFFFFLLRSLQLLLLKIRQNLKHSTDKINTQDFERTSSLRAAGIDFLLRKIGPIRANYSVCLAEPYHPIIFKTVGYHNCLLNNSIKL